MLTLIVFITKTNKLPLAGSPKSECIIHDMPLDSMLNMISGWVGMKGIFAWTEYSHAMLN